VAACRSAIGRRRDVEIIGAAPISPDATRRCSSALPAPGRSGRWPAIIVGCEPWWWTGCSAAERRATIRAARAEACPAHRAQDPPDPIMLRVFNN
jgi:hypothetical protein